MQLIDAQGSYVEEVGEGFLRIDQHIPDELIANLKSERMASATLRAGENHRVASVPTACYDLWIRQGRDPFKWGAKELIRVLQAEGLDAFITTNKQL